MEQSQSTQSPNPNQREAWLHRLALEAKRTSEASENFDFVVAHAHEYTDSDLHIAMARGRLYNRVQGLVEWYRAGERLRIIEAIAEAV